MNGIDFLRACATNVQRVENILKLEWTFYKPDASTGESADLQCTILDLRARGILCTCVGDELWTFIAANPETTSKAEEVLGAYNLQAKGSLEHDFSTDLADGRSVRDTLLGAVEGAFTYVATRHARMLHVASWTWLFRNDTEERNDGHCWEGVLVHFDVRLSAEGKLFFSMLTSDAPRIHHANADASNLVLVPSGRAARLLPSKATEVSRTVVDSTLWRERVRESLYFNGLKSGNDELWASVELVDIGSSQTRHCTWPQSLCLVVGEDCRNEAGLATIESSWASWFHRQGDHNEHFEDPLSIAERWFADAADRVASALKGTPASESQHPVEEGDQAASEVAMTPAGATMNVTSPPFNQRIADQQAAMSLIYPTPPDGFAPSHALPLASQAEPSSIPNTQASPADEHIHAGGGELGSSTAGPNMQASTDDLFGDMGEISFGSNEIGDADFDYFDDPDDLPAENHLDVAKGTKAPLLSSINGEATTGLSEDVHMHGMESPVRDDVTRGSSAHNDQESTTQANLDLDPPAPNMDKGVPSPRPTSPRSPKLQERTTKQPLSPFGIRERLLPPPIPASTTSNDTNVLSSRRSSVFAPVVFNKDLHLYRKYPSTEDNSILESCTLSSTKAVGNTGPSIGLPPKRKTTRVKTNEEPASPFEIANIDGETDSLNSDSSSSEDETLPAFLPRESRKRKRPQDSAEVASLHEIRGEQQASEPDLPAETIDRMLKLTLHPELDRSWQSLLHLWANQSLCGNTSYSFARDADVADAKNACCGPLNLLLELTDLDLVYVAQIVVEQAVSVTRTIVQDVDQLRSASHDRSFHDPSEVRQVLDRCLKHVFPETERCELPSILLSREQPRNMIVIAGKPAQVGQPRPPPLRGDGTAPSGPDYFNLPLPHVRVHRGPESYEMLPTALDFWQALNLGPKSGQKDITAICVLPKNEDLIHIAKDFLIDLGHAYEGCKLGSFRTPTAAVDDADGFDVALSGFAPVELTGERSVGAAVKAYADTCAALGKQLAVLGHREPNRTIVIYLLDPFFDLHSRQRLCACFWLLYKSYRDLAPRGNKVLPRSDIILQILPISLIADPGKLVLLDAQQMCALARETYDHCPPSPTSLEPSESGSALQTLLTTTAVELAIPPPKRIAFQLQSEPPIDLLHEGSILHLAYATSSDGRWMSFSWLDGTGKYAQSLSVCLRGRSFAQAAEKVWEKTLAIMTAREVTWRVFIVTHEPIEKSALSFWHELVARVPRKQILHITLLSVTTQPEVELSLDLSEMPFTPSTNVPNQSTSDFLTPGSTPQAINATVSPDASGQAPSNLNAPPTPAPSEPTNVTASSIPEHDPDAYLLDLTSEAWGMLLAPSFSSATPIPASEHDPATPLATALLLHRGHADIAFPTGTPPTGKLDGLGVKLYWDVRVWPTGQVDEGPVRQAEVTLRDVLKMYRAMALLAKVRGVGTLGGCENVPLQVVTAVRGAEALAGLL